MNELPQSLLLDTNVWLDNYDGTRPLNKQSREMIDKAFAHDTTLLYPVCSLKDVYYNLVQSMKNASRNEGMPITNAAATVIKELAYASVKNMAEIATAVGADDSDVWLALKMYPYHRDVEDDFVLAAMERSKASFLVTNDVQLIKHANCAAMTSEDMLDYLNTFTE